MGASNFSRGNTSRVFAVLMNEEQTFKQCSECGNRHYDYDYSAGGFEQLMECDNECADVILSLETEDRVQERHDYEDFLRERAEEKVKDLPFTYSEEDGNDNDRNYSGTKVFSLASYKTFGDIDFEIKIIGQVVSAYYEGASLDFILEFDGDEDDEPYYEYSFAYSDMSEGLKKIQQRNAEKWAQKEVEKLKTVIEEIFTEVSMPLKVVATFSNGETIYEKA